MRTAGGGTENGVVAGRRIQELRVCTLFKNVSLRIAVVSQKQANPFLWVGFF